MADDDLMSPDIIFKVVIVGDSAVGKTCLLNRYTRNAFTPDSTPTVGIGYGAKTLEFGKTVVKLQIWDTAGQESFRSIARTFYKGTHGVVLTYSINKFPSFDHLQSWIKEIKDGTDENTPILLVGNMKDLENQREVTMDQAMVLCEGLGLAGYYEVSAATGESVEGVRLRQMFLKLGELMLERSLKKPDRRRRQGPETVVINTKAQEAAIAQKKKKTGCC